MVILVPWKPVAFVFGLLSASRLVSYFGSALLSGKDPFAVSTGHWRPATAEYAKRHSTSPIPIARRSESIVQSIGGTVSTNTTD